MLKTIRQGDSGDEVRVAQYLTGYADRAQASGKYDAAFVAYTCGWQRARKLEPDGIIGPNSWRAMAENAPVCSTTKNRVSAAVCAIQILVGDLTVDGIFGSGTRAAVIAYQSARGLSVDGCVGRNTWNALIVSAANAPVNDPDVDVIVDVAMNPCKHYLQWDSRWKNVRYSTHTNKQTIGNSGCGPTSMAMIMATFIDKDITPVEMCKLAEENGYRTYDTGTAWGFYPFVFRRYKGFAKYISTSSVATLKAALADGALAVCSMNSGDNGFWTSGGHFIVAIGYEGDYICANDPNKANAPRKQREDKFRQCMKQAFIFWPKEHSA